MSLDIITYSLGVLTLFCAMMVLFSQHPIRSVLFLILTFFMITANYIMLNAQFIGIVNIIVYAGAIMVLFLFVLMLLNLSKDNEPKGKLFPKVAAVIAGGILFTVLIAAFRDASLAPPAETGVTQNIGLVENLGRLLFEKYVLPFEVSSVLFIAAMVGAVLLAKRDKHVTD